MEAPASFTQLGWKVMRGLSPILVVNLKTRAEEIEEILLQGIDCPAQVTASRVTEEMGPLTLEPSIN